MYALKRRHSYKFEVVLRDINIRVLYHRKDTQHSESIIVILSYCNNKYVLFDTSLLYNFKQTHAAADHV
jgi:hypothetical protein